jgi:hypothetical protein
MGKTIAFAIRRGFLGSLPAWYKASILGFLFSCSHTSEPAVEENLAESAIEE